jgi:hypothetical protein
VLSALSLFTGILGLAWSAHAQSLAWFAAVTLAVSFVMLLADGLRHDLLA